MRKDAGAEWLAFAGSYSITLFSAGTQIQSAIYIHRLLHWVSRLEPVNHILSQTELLLANAQPGFIEHYDLLNTTGIVPVVYYKKQGLSICKTQHLHFLFAICKELIEILPTIQTAFRL